MLRILRLAEHPDVKMVLPGKAERVTAATALRLASSGNYEGFGSGTRVRKMRPIKETAVWQPCYRTTEAATLQPSLDWLTSL